jgi:hypothetical protein
MNTFQQASSATRIRQGMASSKLTNGLINGIGKAAAIGLAIALIVTPGETRASEGIAFAEDNPSWAASEPSVPVDAFGFLGGISEARFYEPHTTTDNPRDEIRQAAVLYGVDLPMMLSIAKVESDFNPRARTGSYRGLFQLGEIEFKKYGDGSVWDARDNARAAAHMFLVHAEKFRVALGHYPDYAERYMVHQQGIEGAIEHYRHPERVAWQSMCATSEGTLKGERWCKLCIWGNLLPSWKRELRSVDKISSRDFVTYWTKRINLLSNKYVEELSTVAARAPIDHVRPIPTHTSSQLRISMPKPRRSSELLMHQAFAVRR